MPDSPGTALLHRLLATIALAMLSLAGCGTPSLLITPVSNPQRLEEITVQSGRSRFGGDKIAMIELDGMLINARSGGLLQPGENSLSLFAEQLKMAAADDKVKAVVLRINSPGGTVTTSDTMYEMIQRFKKKTHKPVVADLQEIAASGAYYVACSADRIVSHPTSVVGSIGVIFNTFNFEGTLAKIGARSEAIKSGPMKDIASPFKTMTDEERAVMQGMIDEYYARFLSVVKSNRPLLASASTETLRTATDGRVFSGQQALDLGLVDQLGLLTDALQLARQLSNSPGARVVMYKRPYGYRGSIYASGRRIEPEASDARVLKLELPGEAGGPLMPAGFYYLWKP